MDRMIEIFMDKFFQVAEYLCDKFGPSMVEPTAPQCQCQCSKESTTIYFSHSDKMVEGDLFA